MNDSIAVMECRSGVDLFRAHCVRDSCWVVIGQGLTSCERIVCAIGVGWLSVRGLTSYERTLCAIGVGVYRSEGWPRTSAPSMPREALWVLCAINSC